MWEYLSTGIALKYGRWIDVDLQYEKNLFYKISRSFPLQMEARAKHNWHCTIRFVINTTLENVYFILHYHLYFRKEFFLECLYFSEYNIQMLSFFFFFFG